MSGILDYFMAMIMVQLFFSFGVTALVHAMPGAEQSYVTMFSDPAGAITAESIGANLEGNLQNQMQLPLLDLGALIFYSGNLIIDLLLNFFTAIPALITLLLSVFLMFFSVDAYLATQIKVLLYAVLTIFYVVGLMIFILNIRSSQGVY